MCCRIFRKQQGDATNLLDLSQPSGFRSHCKERIRRVALSSMCFIFSALSFAGGAMSIYCLRALDEKTQGFEKICKTTSMTRASVVLVLSLVVSVSSCIVGIFICNASKQTDGWACSRK